MLLEFFWLNSSCYFYFKFVIFQVPEEKLFQILFEIHLYTHSFTFFAIPQLLMVYSVLHLWNSSHVKWVQLINE